MKKIELYVEIVDETLKEEAVKKILETVWCRGSKEAIYREDNILDDAPYYGKPKFKKIMYASWYVEEMEEDDDLLEELTYIKGIKYKVYSTETKEEKYKAPKPKYKSKMLW